MIRKCRPDWDITTPELKAAWQQGRKDLFYPYGKNVRSNARRAGLGLRRASSVDRTLKPVDYAAYLVRGIGVHLLSVIRKALHLVMHAISASAHYIS